MNIQLDSNKASYQITRYEPGSIWINQKEYHNSILIRPDALSIWQPMTLAELNQAHFDTTLKDPPEIFILGTGATLQIPSAELIKFFTLHKIGFEFMDSLRASFTYTLLSSENRNVAAGVLLDCR